MIQGDAVGLFAGAVALGLVHGVEPGHGWPVAASYALDQTNKWLYGLAASVLLGVGHLVSSIAMVVAFFYFKRYFSLAQVDEPLSVGGVEIGGPVGIFAGVLLILLGVREYVHGHDHDHSDGQGHGSGDHSHDHDHAHPGGHGGEQKYAVGRTPDYGQSGGRDHGHTHRRDHRDGILGKLELAVPFVGERDHESADDAADRGLWGIAGFAFVLGFAHEEEFEIIAMCAGSEYCLSLMATYAVTVIVGIVALTLLLIAGYERYEERVERYTDYLPAFSAAVLIAMGVGFALGVL